MQIKDNAYKFDIYSASLPRKKRKNDMTVYKQELWHFQGSATQIVNMCTDISLIAAY